MNEPTPDPFQALIAANPFLALWSLPCMIAGVWMTSCISATARTDARRRNRDPGQIPVPPVLQDSKDKDLFA